LREGGGWQLSALPILTHRPHGCFLLTPTHAKSQERQNNEIIFLFFFFCLLKKREKKGRYRSQDMCERRHVAHAFGPAAMSAVCVPAFGKELWLSVSIFFFHVSVVLGKRPFSGLFCFELGLFRSRDVYHAPLQNQAMVKTRPSEHQVVVPSTLVYLSVGQRERRRNRI
jgi:hypothetical protein